MLAMADTCWKTPPPIPPRARRRHRKPPPTARHRLPRLENKHLRKALGDKRVRLDDDQRRRLAILGKALSRDLLDRFASIVTPETILRRHRRLVALKWTFDNGAKSWRGRPRALIAIEQLVVKMAKENATWGL